MLHTPSRPKNVSPCTVKVENLAKMTMEKDLNERLKNFNITSLKIIQCSEAPVNYAWVNCADQASAEQVVEAVHERMLLHQNRLTAKIKGQKRPYSATSPVAASAAMPVAKPTASTGKDICAVKLLIYDDTLTDAALDLHFQQYGELLTATKIRIGRPKFAYVNYRDPTSAYQARSNSPHIIQGVQVVAVPYKVVGTTIPVNPTEGWLTHELSCKPLAFAAAKREILGEFANQEMVKVDVRGDKFAVHVKGIIASLVKKQIESVICFHESKIETKDVSLEFYYLPVLADLDIQRAIHSIKLPSQVRISRGAQKVELWELAAHYENRSKGSSELATLNQYLTPSATERGDKYQWYWRDDDDTLQPYTEQVSDQIEKKFVDRDRFLRVGIGKYNYTIDTFGMVQTNKLTLKERKMKRESTTSSGVHKTDNIHLQITAHQDHTSELEREIKDIVSKSIQESTVQLPTTAASVKSFTASLLDLARQNYIQATVDKDGLTVMVLKGKNIVVKSTEVELLAEILKKERAMEKMARMSVPAHWDPQVEKCELKPVTKRSSEWNEISDMMQKISFKVEITKIERIQNTWLWETYQMSKKRMSDKNDGVINEKKLFHGPKENKPKDIYDSEQGFDHRLASQGLFGEGTYFAVESSYSHKYAYKLSSHTRKLTGRAYHTTDHTHQLFLVNVITGIACKCSAGERTLKAPPKKSDRHYWSNRQGPTTTKFEGERFDSVCGKSNGSEIYVIYELGRVYPAYLITYTVDHAMDPFF